MAPSSLADRAKAAPAPAGNAVAHCGDDVLRDQQPAGDMARGSADFMDRRTRPFLCPARPRASGAVPRQAINQCDAGWLALASDSVGT
jgi:hypothetical protein